MTSSLIVVGSGIKFLSHLTPEAKTYIEQSEVVLYLVNDPLLKEWIQKKNANTHSLDFLYQKYQLRQESYTAITKYILDELRKLQQVCVVLYGHPAVFAQPGLEAVRQAKKEGFEAIILPGISAEDCLFSDLLIDPGSSGCQSFEATDFLLYKRKFDVYCHLILWQIDMIGMLGHKKLHHKGISLLTNYLKNFYSEDHLITIYEAAQYPSFKPLIQHFQLKNLCFAKFSRISTLYVPPLENALYDENVLQYLEMIN